MVPGRALRTARPRSAWRVTWHSVLTSVLSAAQMTSRTSPPSCTLHGHVPHRAGTVPELPRFALRSQTSRFRRRAIGAAVGRTCSFGSGNRVECDGNNLLTIHYAMQKAEIGQNRKCASWPASAPSRVSQCPISPNSGQSVSFAATGNCVPTAAVRQISATDRFGGDWYKVSAVRNC